MAMQSWQKIVERFLESHDGPKALLFSRGRARRPGQRRGGGIAGRGRAGRRAQRGSHDEEETWNVEVRAAEQEVEGRRHG